MQFAGKAVDAHNARIYNCSVRHIDSIRAFSEVFYLLLCGCGVGIGLSKFFLGRLPDLVGKEDKTGSVITYTVQDTIEGWADSLEALLNCYFRNTAYTGRKIVFDYSRIRKKGEPLKTSGGKAPGYKGLKNAHKKIKELLDYAIEEKDCKRLLSIDAYDILMHSADAVLSGGVRRSATCVVFDKDDIDMMDAKILMTVKKNGAFEKGEKWEGYVYHKGKKVDVALDDFEYGILKKEQKVPWHHLEPQRGRSNNSVLLLRGHFTLDDVLAVVKRTREGGDPGFVFADHPWTIFNPCYEISFIPVTEDGVCGVQFCNLTSQNGAMIKTSDDFLTATKADTIIGTLQATYTNFSYLGNVSKFLTEDEALLGVSITGMMDNPKVLLSAKNQREAAELAIQTNREWAEKLGINPAARVTCVKPEGTSSLVLMSGSGIHPWHSKRFFRRVQMNRTDPVFKFFKKHNPHMCENSTHSENKTDEVVTFAITAPDGAMVKDDLTAIHHLEIIKSTQKNWVLTGSKNSKKPITNNVSCTVIVKDEWDDVAQYLFDNQKYFSAVSLLGYFGDKEYQQAPLEKITEVDEAKWDEIVSKFTPVDYTQLKEDDDMTEAAQTLSCAGGQCEIY